MSVIQLAFRDIDQKQIEPVYTENELVPPAAGTLAPGALSVNVQAPAFPF